MLEYSEDAEREFEKWHNDYMNEYADYNANPRDFNIEVEFLEFGSQCFYVKIRVPHEVFVYTSKVFKKNQMIQIAGYDRINEDGSFDYQMYVDNNYVTRSLILGLLDSDFQSSCIKAQTKAKLLESLDMMWS